MSDDCSPLSCPPVEDLHKELCKEAHDLTDWYMSKARRNKRVSRGLRHAAWALGVLGGLCPLLQPVLTEYSWTSKLGEFGYLLIAGGVAAYMLDNFFGYSTGWMRFIYTHLQLKNTLRQHEVDWAELMTCQECMFTDKNEHDLDAIQKQKIECIRELALKLHLISIKETEEWMAEFRGRLKDFEQHLKNGNGSHK